MIEFKSKFFRLLYFYYFLGLINGLTPKPISNLPLAKIQGLWYVVYISPNPYNVTNNQYITCWNQTFQIFNESTKVNFIQNITILGKNIQNKMTLDIQSGNNSIWKLGLFEIGWLDLDPIYQEFGLIANLIESSFWIVSRTPILNAAIINEEIELALIQGYSNTSSIEPVNTICYQLNAISG